MAGLYVVPLRLGHIVRDKSAFLYLKDMGKVQDFPIIAWYIGGGETKILVDTGTNSPEETAPFHLPLIRTPDESLPAALASIGIQPSDIQIVVNTHLHWDHCYNNHLFPEARFYVQREELRYAIDPLPVHVHGYEPPSIGMKTTFLGTRFSAVEGDVQIAPGVSLISTPGHSPGSQSVLVDTPTARIIIASDTVPLFESWDGATSIPNAVHVDLESYYRTFQRIADLKPDIVLPGHDQRVFDKERYP
jgi:N-acyl homoserine lactone hydrolase